MKFLEDTFFHIKREDIMREEHEGVVGGHYVGNATAHKIIREGLWWPMIFKDTKYYCTTCDVYRRVGKSSIRDELPLNPHITLRAFDKWEADFVGPINPSTWSTGARYITITIDYLTRWEKAVKVKDCSMETTTKFLFEQVITRFGCLKFFYE